MLFENIDNSFFLIKKNSTRKEKQLFTFLIMKHEYGPEAFLPEKKKRET